MTTTMPDPAAVEAVSQMAKAFIIGRLHQAEQAERIITKAYAPRLTSEREVLKKLVSALQLAHDTMRTIHETIEQETSVMPRLRAALAAAKKLEGSAT